MQTLYLNRKKKIKITKKDNILFNLNATFFLLIITYEEKNMFTKCRNLQLEIKISTNSSKLSYFEILDQRKIADQKLLYCSN